MLASAFHRGRVGVAAGLLALAAMAPAQAPTPGQVQEQVPIRSPAELRRAVPEAAVPDRAPRQVPEGGPEIRVEQFELSGNSVIPTEELLAELEPFRGEPLTLLELYALADRLEALYRERGFLLSSVTLPAQNVSTGTVRFEVIEGRVARILFEGNRNYSDDYLARQTDQLLSGEALERDTLEREVLLLNDLPGLSARAVIRPGDEFGTSDVILRTEEKPWAAFARIDNHGRETVGEWRIGADLLVNNPLRHGDQLGLSALHAEGGLLDYYAISYDIAVGTRGTRVGAFFSRLEYEVDVKQFGPAFAGLELEGDGNNYRLDVSHPLIRSRQRNVIVGAAVSRNETDQSGDLVVPETDGLFVNLLSLEASWSEVHGNDAVSTASAVFSTNFDGNDDGTENNAQAGKLRVDASHLHPLGADWSLLFRGTAVLSIDPLIDIERFRIGGPASVRGFPAAEIGGDEGFALTAQVNRRLRLFERIETTVRAFWDGGKVYRKEPVAGEKPNASLTSVGVGLTARYRNFSLDVEAARPTNTHDVSDGEDSGRVWALLSASF